MKKTIVLIGKVAAGKDYAGEYLAKKLGVESVGISSGLRAIAQERGIPETRENLIEIGKELTKKYGDAYLAEVLVENTPKNIMIITGPRQLGQLAFLRENTESIFIGIDADPKIRYQRVTERGKVGEDISFERFLQEEQMEEEANQNSTQCLQQCDIIIENNGTLESFEQKLDSLAIF